METNFNFKSSVCTSLVQSELLLALGLKKETADMRLIVNDFGDVLVARPLDYVYSHQPEHIPAWSLHRLIEMMPEEMYGGLLCIFKDSIRYEELIMDRPEAHFEAVGDNMYENAISCIEWLIKEGYFNKEYLV